MDSAFLLVDTTNSRALARHENWIALSALAYIQFANCDTHVIRLGANRGFAAFDGPTLHGIIKSLGGKSSPTLSYPELISATRRAAEAAEWLVLPFDMEVLREQARCIEPTDDRPYAFEPEGTEPELLRKWHCDPQRNRQRYDTDHWQNFRTDGHEGTGTRQTSPEQLQPAASSGRMGLRKKRRVNHSTTEETNMATSKTTTKAPAAPAKKTIATSKTPVAPGKAPKAPAAPVGKKGAAPAAPKKGAAPAAPKAAKAAKVERENSNGINRPKPGTNGDKIWSAADKLSKPGKPAAYVDVAAKLGDTVNEASSRAGYQRWRTFNGHKGRASASA